MDKQTALQIMCTGLKDFRTRKGWSQDQLGQILDCGKANISNIENKKGFPAMESVFTLIENGMTLEELFGKELADKLQSPSRPESPMEQAQRLKGEMQALLQKLESIEKDIPD